MRDQAYRDAIRWWRLVHKVTDDYDRRMGKINLIHLKHPVELDDRLFLIEEANNRYGNNWAWK